MKYSIYHLIGFLSIAALIFHACGEDEIVFSEPSHRVVYTSEMDFENKVEVGGKVTFGDVSPGIVSRMWTFPEEGVSIDVSSTNTSTEPIVQATFLEAGLHEVHLHQEFEEGAYVGTTQQGSSLDTTIVITVLPPVSLSIEAYHVLEDGTTGDPLTLSDGALNQVTASKSVRFIYTVDGEPEHFTWTFDGGDPGVDATGAPELDVKYKKLGTYDVSLIAGRERPNGADTVSYADLITVIPSTDPVDLEEITERDGDIALVFSREMDAFTLSPSAFSVTIQNGETIMHPAIRAARVDPIDGNIVLLSLDGESIYNDDEITVSYTAGSLSTTDAVAATSFESVPLVFDLANLLSSSAVDESFENSENSNWPYLWWGGVWGEYDLEISTDRAHTGDRSAYIEYRPNGGMIIGHRDLSGADNTFNVEQGKTYELGVWVYLEDVGSNDPEGFDPDLRFYWAPATNWAVGPNPAFTPDFSLGEWVYSSVYVEFGHDGATNFMIRGFNEANPETLKFYMDDLTLSEVTLRP